MQGDPRKGLLLLIIFLGCAPTEPVGVETSTGVEAIPEIVSEALPQPVMRVGHHPLGEEEQGALEWWSEESPSNQAPIVYGWQGAFMIILALECENWPANWAELKVLVQDEDWVVASYIDASLELSESPSGQVATNLFVVTHGWEEYVDVPLALRVELTHPDASVEWSGTLLFEEPEAPVWD